MKFLVVGLGNPGKEYEETRHNIGFKVLDSIANESSTFFSPDRLADVCTVKHKGRTLILIKPTTFMNLSGKAVKYWMDKEGIAKENLLIVTDDLALPFGTLRMRSRGSDGGHNGLKDIQATLMSGDYPRLKFGIGNEFQKGRQVDYVLGKWSEEEKKTLDEKINKSKEMVFSFCFAGIAQTMSQYNN